VFLRGMPLLQDTYNKLPLLCEFFVINYAPKNSSKTRHLLFISYNNSHTLTLYPLTLRFAGFFLSSNLSWVLMAIFGADATHNH
jgi:hypothetical protein